MHSSHNWPRTQVFLHPFLILNRSHQAMTWGLRLLPLQGILYSDPCMSTVTCDCRMRRSEITGGEVRNEAARAPMIVAKTGGQGLRKPASSLGSSVI